MRCSGSSARCGAARARHRSKTWSSRRQCHPAGRRVFPSSESWMTEALKSRIRHVPDFPKAGILFYDVTTLLRDPEGFRLAIDNVAMPFQDKAVSLVVGIESRGFILGAAVADRIGAGFVPVRKVGKLPAEDR